MADLNKNVSQYFSLIVIFLEANILQKLDIFPK
jgi:hypothetical protein